MSPLHLLHLPVDRVEGEVAAAFYFEDERPLRGPAALLDWRLNGLLTDLLLREELTGRSGERLLVPNNGKLGAERVLLAGGGRWAALDRDGYQRLVAEVLEICRSAGFSRICLALRPAGGEGEEALRVMVSRAMQQIRTPIECLLTVESADGFGR